VAVVGSPSSEQVVVSLRPVDFIISPLTIEGVVPVAEVIPTLSTGALAEYLKTRVRSRMRNYVVLPSSRFRDQTDWLGVYGYDSSVFQTLTIDSSGQYAMLAKSCWSRGMSRRCGIPTPQAVMLHEMIHMPRRL